MGHYFYIHLPDNEVVNGAEREGGPGRGHQRPVVHPADQSEVRIWSRDLTPTNSSSPGVPELHQVVGVEAQQARLAPRLGAGVHGAVGLGLV